MAASLRASAVTLELHPVTFWRRVLPVRVRARQLARREIPTSPAALGAAVTAPPRSVEAG